MQSFEGIQSTVVLSLLLLKVYSLSALYRFRLYIDVILCARY